ncbi:hypothetical protein ACLB9X_02215 [Streptomyces sp. 5K101]|uniref:hypothetical protein n=1 Tax=Streptomyces sp. 5K101 TaxID=3390037 RepID=UPI0039748FFE
MKLSSSSPVDAVLAQWLPRDVMRGKEPFDVESVVRGLDTARLRQLILDFDELLDVVLTRTRHNIYWDLPPLGEGEAPAYVPAGPRMRSRMTHAALYTDRLLVEPPRLPTWPIGEFLLPSGPADVLRHTLPEPSAAAPSRTIVPPPEVPTPAGDAKNDIDEILDEIDAIDARIDEDFARAGATLESRLSEVAQDLLKYWWEVREPLAEGWLHVVGGGLLSTDNIKDICRDPEFRAELPEWSAPWGVSAKEAWRQLMKATGLAHCLGREHVVTFPGAPETKELIALTSRFYTSLPYGGVLVGDWYPSRRLVVAGGGEVERGHWYDELLIGLGPAARFLDLQAACELRREGTASSLRHWLTSDMNQVAFAAARGDDPEVVLQECRAQLGRIASAADHCLQQTSCATLRARLQQAGIWGTAGLITGVVTTVISGGTFLVAVAAGGVGFTLSAAAGAAGSRSAADSTVDPVIFDVMRQAAAARQRQPQ